MVRFYVKGGFFNLNDTLYVSNNRYQVIYTIKNDTYLRKFENKYSMFNLQDEKVAEFQLGVRGKAIHLYVDVNGERYATITTNKGLSTKGFQIEPQQMKTIDSKAKLNYTVVQGEETIATIHTKLLRLRDTYAIEYIAKNEEDIVILIALAVFIKVRDPSLIGSLFKTIE